jgi:Sec-independent protein translocase protein TatA
VDGCLRNVSSLVKDVRPYVSTPPGGRGRLTEALDALSGSIKTARQAIAELQDALDQELRQQALEKDRSRLRSNKRYRKDRQELRRGSEKVETCLADLSEDMNELLDWLRGR